jgi:membrane protein DedA with SNARE-associated domain
LISKGLKEVSTLNIETITHYIDLYGYVIIFLFLYCGIIGIPAPEESLLFLIGILIVQNTLSFGLSILSATLGAITGMLTAYLIGKNIGYPFIRRFGKYVGINGERWEEVKSKYSRNSQKTILFGFYMPGIRQISPYFAGITKFPFGKFFVLTLLGSISWTVPFIAAGYYSGKFFHINPRYVPYLGIVFLLVFLIYVAMKFVRSKAK